MMALLSKDDIFAADDLPTEDVPVPEWSKDPENPDDVRVRGLTGTERDRFEIRIANSGKKGDVSFRSELVARCIVDEEGERVFKDTEIRKLGNKSGAALDRVFDVVRKLSGMTDGAAEEVAEDFGSALDDDSPSD